MSLQKKAVSATLWSGIDMFARKGVQFGISMVLARLLTPADYGTVALLAIFIGIAGVLADSGFFTALIQRKEASQVDLSSVFYFNIGLSLVTAAILCLAAPWIASFYKMPVLKPLTWVLALNLALGSLGSIQSALLCRALDFRRQCVISLAALFVSGAVAIAMAWQHFGVWSLAIQTIVSTIVSTILLWTLSSWRPGWAFSVASIRSMFGFGGFMLLSGLTETIFARLTPLVIGRIYLANDVGLYTRAESTSFLPGDISTGIIKRVTFPIFASTQNDKTRLKNGLRKAITLVMMINIPMMVGMAVTARPLVLVLFGAQWLPCVPYLQILCVNGLLLPLLLLNSNALIAQGFSSLYFRLAVITKIVGVVLLGTACLFGLAAIAWGAVLAGIFCFWYNAHFSKRFLGYGFLNQITDLLPCLGVAMVMAACVLATNLLPIDEPFFQLAIQVAVGAVVYVSLGALFKMSAFINAWALIRPIIVSRLLPEIA